MPLGSPNGIKGDPSTVPSDLKVPPPPVPPLLKAARSKSELAAYIEFEPKEHVNYHLEMDNLRALCICLKCPSPGSSETVHVR